MLKKITLVGCGQIGSRHLQALAQLDQPLRIQIVEPNLANRNIAKLRYQEVALEKTSSNIEWLNDLAGLEPQSDLTIVATNANGRAELLKSLVHRGHKRFLVEKMVCQSQKEYDDLLHVFSDKSCKAWVHCARSYYPFYEKLISLLQHEKIVYFHALAGNFGLGCNAIHLLALYHALVNNDQNMRLFGNFLVEEILPNKRGGNLLEFAGAIVAKTGTQSVASVNFHPLNDASVIISILTTNWKAFIDEGNGKALLASKETNWTWDEYKFETIPTSRLTTQIANEILCNDDCRLPTLQDSYVLHVELFRIFNEHINALTGEIPLVCPIT